MEREGVYLIKVVDILPKRGNSNYLYTLRGQDFRQFYEWDTKVGTFEINDLESWASGTASVSVTAGTNTTVTGTGTLADPYIINTTGGGASTANAISVVPGGNLSATDVQAALSELQGDIDVNVAAIALNTAKISADGSVTTHNDVTDAGSGVIITVAERLLLHADDDVESVTGDNVDNTNIRNPIIQAEIISPVTELDIGNTAPVGAKKGVNPLTGDEFYVDDSGDWQIFANDSIVNDSNTWSSQKIVDFVKALTADIETDPAKAGKISFDNGTAKIINYTEGSHEYFLNDVYLTTLQDKGEVFSFTGTEGDILSSPTGLFNCVTESAGTSSWATLGFAGKIFGITVTRNTPVTIKIASFETPPSVEVYDSTNTLIDTVNIASNSLGTVTLSVNGTYRFESTEDISLFYQGTIGVDYAVVTPSSMEGYHWSTGTSGTLSPNISAIYDNTTVEVTYANGTVDTATITSAGGTYATINRASQYAESSAYYWKSDRPVVAYAVADQDGSSASFGTPKTAMGNLFGISLNAEHVSIISQSAGYVIRLDENGNYVDTTNFNNNGTSNVWTMRFTNQIAGYTYITSTLCTMVADYTHGGQATVGGDESLVLGGKVADLRQIPIVDKNDGSISWLTLDNGTISILNEDGNSQDITSADFPIASQASWADGDFGVWNATSGQFEPATISETTGTDVTNTLNQLTGTAWSVNTSTSPGNLDFNWNSDFASYVQEGNKRYYSLRMYFDNDSEITFEVTGAQDVVSVQGIGNSLGGGDFANRMCFVKRDSANVISLNRDDDNDVDMFVDITFTAIM